MPREVVYEAITNDMIETYSYSGIEALMFAEGGAMGNPGEIRVFSLKNSKVYVRKNNYAYGDFRMNDFAERFPPLNNLKLASFGRLVHIDEGWKYYYLGYGNHLIMTSALFEKTKADFVDKSPPRKYAIYEATILNVMKDMPEG